MPANNKLPIYYWYPITGKYMDAWEYLDDSNGEVGEFFYDLGVAWTEALLSTELTPREREAWSGKLEAWWEELEIYAGGEALDAALLAVEQGWDHPPLLRVLEVEFRSRRRSTLTMI